MGANRLRVSVNICPTKIAAILIVIAHKAQPSEGTNDSNRNWIPARDRFDEAEHIFQCQVRSSRRVGHGAVGNNAAAALRNTELRRILALIVPLILKQALNLECSAFKCQMLRRRILNELS